MIKIEIEGIEDLIKFVEIIRHTNSHEAEKLIKQLTESTKKLDDAVQANK